MINLTQVSFARGDRNLVTDITCELAMGKVTAIMGANGAGKTTLIRIISGETHPSSGSLYCYHRPPDEWNARDLARWRAVVPQNSYLSFSFSVLDVVMLGRLPHGWSLGKRDEEIADEALDLVGLNAFRARDYTTLSGGERQRVHLARALTQLHEARARRHGFLMLDEPTAHLDLSHQQSTMELVRQLADQGLGVLVVMHDLNLAARFADTVLLLRDGQLVASGSPKDVLEPALIRQVFGVDMTRVSAPDGTPAFLPTQKQSAKKEVSS